MPAPNKSSSRWGSFLSQAVAGVESRLDNILAEDEGASSIHEKPQLRTQASVQAPASAVPAAAKAAPSASRSSSGNRTNERLQARLAKAMTGKNSQSDISPRSSVDNASRPSLECQPANSKPIGKIDLPTADALIAETEQKQTLTEASIDQGKSTQTTWPVNDGNTQDNKTNEYPTISTKFEATAIPVEKYSTATSEAALKEEVTASSDEIKQLRTSHQQDIQEYVERIDLLESKLSYLAKSAADSARQTANSLASGDYERKIAEKDEKIALLMEEGQKLATGEQAYRNLIKKLRKQLGDSERQTAELEKSRLKAVDEANFLRVRLDGIEENEKRQEMERKSKVSLQKEMESLKKDKTTREEILRKLERDLKTKTEEADKAANLAKILAIEREQVKTQEDNLKTAQKEKDELAEKAKQECIEWSEKLDRAVERGRKAEEELRVELKAMETKLEFMRAQAEEATAGSASETQVKLLRQIETLQSQYASASSNWQSMESSLRQKLSSLEREKDDLQKRESDMRKKARDSLTIVQTSRARGLDEELQDIRPALAKTREQLETIQDQFAVLKTSSKTTEEALCQARSDLEREQRDNKRNLASKQLQQKKQLQQQSESPEDAPSSVSKLESQLESPVPAVARTFSSDLSGLSGLLTPQRIRMTPLTCSIPESDVRGGSRRPSTQRLRDPSSSPKPSAATKTATTISLSNTPVPCSPLQQSTSEFGILGSPSPVAKEEDDGDNGLGIDHHDQQPAVTTPPPSSPRHTPVQDMISMSTVAAGPSVQLVERMSAAIRRLEAEKVGAREEMARVCHQRDEARADMVRLMKELEDARMASARVPDLEIQVSNLDARYQITLEMLGEKSELVEELRADVQDVKAMYRELVEQTMK